MNYDELFIDYVKRTKSNLEFIESHQSDGVYEFTQLMNSLLGFVVLPREKNFNDIPKYSFDELRQLGWELPLIRKNKFKIKELRSLIRIFRNSIAHFNLKFLNNEQNEINGIVFYNRNKKNIITFEAEFRINELRSFTNRLIEVFISEN